MSKKCITEESKYLFFEAVLKDTREFPMSKQARIGKVHRIRMGLRV
jgi:hypothetical protein